MGSSFSSKAEPECEPILPAGKKGWADTTVAGSEVGHTPVKDETPPPPDRYNLVFIIMTIHGIGVLIPWNVLINAKDYFTDYKLAQIGNQSSPALTDHRVNFVSYISIASILAVFSMHVVNIMAPCQRDRLGIRSVCGILTIMVGFVFTLIMVVVDTSTWQDGFFWLTIVSAVIINGAAGLYQNSMMGIAASLPMKYNKAIILGNNLSGLVVASMNIMTLLMTPVAVTSGLYYFSAPLVVLAIALCACTLLTRTKLYRYYAMCPHEKEETQSPGSMYRLLRETYGRILPLTYHLQLSMFLIFSITFSLFPAVLSDIAPMTTNINGPLWSAIFSFFLFNLCATGGNLVTGLIRWPSHKWMVVTTTSLALFIPFFLLANFRAADRTIPVYVSQDWVFILGVIIFGAIYGYLSSLTVMYAPRLVAPGDAQITGMVMGVCLIFGLLCGVSFSRIWPLMI